MIEMGKTYTTRSGLPVRILATNVKNYYPVIGVVQLSPTEERAEYWTADGHYIPINTGHRVYGMDLIEPLVCASIHLWALYTDTGNTFLYKTKEERDAKIQELRRTNKCFEFEVITEGILR